MLKELEPVSKTLSILKTGFFNRGLLDFQRNDFLGIMKQYDPSIFEAIFSSGKVVYRFHRPSDFEDKILLNHPESEKTFMNEGQTPFLRLVELSNGDPTDPERLLKNEDEVADDLYIIKIEHKMKSEPLRSRESENSAI
ncbi:hypothetical protein AB3N59_19915 [Leptospira sp. WS92.C1]